MIELAMKESRIVAALRYYEGIAGFALPLLEQPDSGSRFAVQEIDEYSNGVTGFRILDGDTSDAISVSNGPLARIGESQIYAFFSEDGALHVGNLETLESTLKEFSNRCADDVVVLLQIAELIGTQEEKLIAYGRMRHVIADKTGAESAHSYYEHSLLHAKLWDHLVTHATNAGAAARILRSRAKFHPTIGARGKIVLDLADLDPADYSKTNVTAITAELEFMLAAGGRERSKTKKRQPNLDEWISMIEAADSVNQLREVGQKAAEAFGFNGVQLIDANPNSLDIRDSDLKRIMARARHTNTPFEFDWDPAANRQEVAAIRKDELNFRIPRYSNGGFVIPFHFSDSHGSVQSRLAIFFWHDATKRIRFSISSRKFEIHLIAIYWAQRSVDLISDRYKEKPSLLEFESLQDPLTTQERDVLAWAARGKSVLDTSNILALPEPTVRKHIQAALNKLGANNQTYGITKAIYLGLINV